MKKFAFFCIYFFLSLPLFAATYSVTIDNDALTGTDEHYTNGFFYTWLSDDNNPGIPNWFNFGDSLNRNLAISFAHLTFTPKDISESEVITDDMPYAGYMNLSFFFFQSNKNYFHEVGIGLGMTGPYTRSKEIQTGLHKMMGNSEPKGWGHQIGTQFMPNVSYQFGIKTTPIELSSNLICDWTNHIRFDLGEFYTGALIGTSFRIGSFARNNFQTTGNFIGGEESSLLNFQSSKGLGWAFSYGIFANSIKNFYIVDDIEKYNFNNITYTKGRVAALSLYYQDFEFALKFKSLYLDSGFNIKSESAKRWGGIVFNWKF